MTRIERSVLLHVLVVGACLPATAARLGLVANADTQADSTFIGDAEGDLLGMSQAIGDLDGDGIDDLLIGTLDDFRPARLEIFRGPLVPGLRDLRTQSADTEIVSSGLGSRLGVDFNLLLADLNGDGHLDIVAGSPLERQPVPGRAGVVHVLFGPFAPGAFALDALPGFHVLGAEDFDHSFLGIAVAVGDLSGDGVPDLVVGDALGGCCGRALVFYGPFSPGTLDLAVTPADYELGGGTVDGRFGSGLAVADVSGDGKPDLMVGEPQANGALGLHSGAIHVLGGPLPPVGIRVLIRGAHGGVPPDGEGGDGIGEIVRTGDLDADGNTDIITTGTRIHDHGRQADGLVSIIFGPFLEPTIDLIDAPNQANIIAARRDDRVGYSILVADVSADGLPDLIIGADNSRIGCGGAADPGVAHVFHAPIAHGTRVDLAIDVADMTITSTEPRARCGIALAAEDLDADRTTELVFGCNLADRPDGSGADAGIVYVLSPERLVGQAPGPCCDAGAPTTVPCDAPRGACGVDVQLDGSASRDVRGMPLQFDWEVGCGPSLVVAGGESPVVCLDAAPGESCTATLTVSAPDGRTASCMTTIDFAADAGPPVLSGLPASVVVECDAVPPPPVVSASDDCGAPAVTFDERREAGACDDAYRLVRTWTATDIAGNIVTAERVITVRDGVAPELLGVPPAILVGCGAVPAPAPVEAHDGCDPSPSLTMVETVVPGNCAQSILRTWTARDRCGNEASASQAIEVRDDEAPVVAASHADLAVLWAPNHRMTCFDAAALAPSISEACSLPVTWRLVDCVSDQPDDGRGDGATHDDCVVAPDGQSACVRSERAGGSQSGRRYTLTVIASDACGNASAPTLVGVVRVPHDQRRRR